MAITNITLGFVSGLAVHVNTDVDESEDDVAAAAGTLYQIQIDNTGNAAVTYVKLYDAGAAAVTVGTTAPDWIFRVAASVSRTIPFPEGAAFATALSVAALTAGGTAGTTGPTSAVTVRIVYA